LKTCPVTTPLLPFEPWAPEPLPPERLVLRPAPAVMGAPPPTAGEEEPISATESAWAEPPAFWPAVAAVTPLPPVGVDPDAPDPGVAEVVVLRPTVAVVLPLPPFGTLEFGMLAFATEPAPADPLGAVAPAEAVPGLPGEGALEVVPDPVPAEPVTFCPTTASGPSASAIWGAMAAALKSSAATEPMDKRSCRGFKSYLRGLGPRGPDCVRVRRGSRLEGFVHLPAGDRPHTATREVRG